MRFAFVVWVAFVAVLFSTRASAALDPASAAVLCADFKNGFDAPVPTKPRFRVVDGTVILDDSDDATIVFEGAKTAAARVWLVRGDERQALLCGPVAAQSVYKLPAADGWSRYEIELYDLEPTTSPTLKASFATRRSALEASAIANAYEKAHLLDEFEKSLRDRTVKEAADALDDMPAKECMPPIATDCRADKRPIADALRAVRGDLERAKSMLRIDNGEEASAAWRAALEHAGSAARDAAPSTNDTPANQKTFCGREAELAWLDAPGDADGNKLFRRVTISLPTSKRFSAVAYGSGVHAVEAVPANTPWSILVRNVPFGTKLKVGTKFSDPPELKIDDLLLTFLKTVAPATTGGAKRTMLRVLPSLCPADKKIISAEIPPAVTSETRTVVVQPEEEKITEVTICEGDACKVDGDSPTVRNTVRLNPPKKARFTLLLDLGINLLGIFVDADHRGDDAYAHSKMEPVGGLTGPSQRYALRRDYDVRDRGAISLLAAVRWDRLVLGVGPGLIDFNGEAAFNHWCLRVGIGISESFVLNAGFGVRFGKRLVATQAYGDEVSVLRTTPGQEPAAPSINEETVPSLTFGLGIAFDLATVGSSAGDIVSAIRGDSAKKN